MAPEHTEPTEHIEPTARVYAIALVADTVKDARRLVPMLYPPAFRDTPESAYRMELAKEERVEFDTLSCVNTPIRAQYDLVLIIRGRYQMSGEILGVWKKRCKKVLVL